MSERFEVGDRVRLAVDYGGHFDAVPFGQEGVVFETIGTHVRVNYGRRYGIRGGNGSSLELLSRDVTQPVFAPPSPRLDAVERVIRGRMSSRFDARAEAAAALAAADAVDPVRTDLAAALRNLTRLQLEHAEREGRL